MTNEEIREAIQTIAKRRRDRTCIDARGQYDTDYVDSVSTLADAYLTRLAADEQRERDVSELLRAVAKIPHDAEAATLVEQYIMCGPKNAAMFLRERNAADDQRDREDAEPIGRVWFRENGNDVSSMFVCRGSTEYEIEAACGEPSVGIDLTLYECGKLQGIMTIKHITTRGQLRKLLEALAGGGT